MDVDSHKMAQAPGSVPPYEQSWPRPQAGDWRTMIIIAWSLIASVVVMTIMFGAVFGFRVLIDSNFATMADAAIALYGLATLPIAFLIVPIVTRGKAKQVVATPKQPEQMPGSPELGQLTEIYQQRMIIGLALLEGATLANLLAFFVIGHNVQNFLLALILMIAMFWFVPRSRHWQKWLGRVLPSD